MATQKSWLITNWQLIGRGLCNEWSVMRYIV